MKPALRIVVAFVGTIAAVSCRAPGSSPVTLTRQPDGEWALEGHRHGPAVTLNISASKQSSRANAFSVRGHSQNPSVLHTRHIAILNGSDGRIAGAVGLAFQRRLADLPFVDRIDYYPFGHRPGEIERVPDLIVRYSVVDYDWLWLPFYYGASARVVADTPLSLGSIRADGGFLPWVDLSWKTRLDHRQRLFGIATHDSLIVAEALGEKLAGELAGFLSEAVAEYGTPEPSYFLERHGPPSVDEELLAPFRGFPLAPLFAGSAPLHRSVSVWQFVDARPQPEALRDLAARLRQDGWTLRAFSPEYDNDIRATRAQDVVLISGMASFEPIVVGDSDDEGADPANASFTLLIAEALSRDDMVEALRTLLDPSVDLDALLPYAGLCQQLSSSLGDAVARRLVGEGRTLPRAHLGLAKLRSAAGELETARRHLAKAEILRRVRLDGELEDEIEELAKKIGAERELEGPFPPELYRELGFVELEPKPLFIERELAAGAPVFACFEQLFGGTGVLGAEIIELPEPDAYQLVTYAPGRRGERPTRLSGEDAPIDADGWRIGRDGQFHARLDIRQTADKRLRVVITVKPWH